IMVALGEGGEAGGTKVAVLPSTVPMDVTTHQLRAIPGSIGSMSRLAGAALTISSQWVASASKGAVESSPRPPDPPPGRASDSLASTFPPEPEAAPPPPPLDPPDVVWEPQAHMTAASAASCRTFT